MSLLQALILGIVQGFTEFLPVSSSAHLSLTQYFMGFDSIQDMIFFDLVCHLGTLFAIFTLYKEQIFTLCKTPSQIKALILGTLPLFPLVLLIKPIKHLFDRLDLIGFFFLITALLIWLGNYLGDRVQRKETKLDPLFVGLFQALAIIPGISRSGSTISGARMLGWNKEKAVTFSFLLAIPAILGAFVLEFFTLLKNPPSDYSYLALIVGFSVSYVTGIIALKIVIRYATKKNLLPFAWYCLILGLTTLIYFNYGKI